MDLGITGKTAVVTAAGGGLGSEVVKRLLEEGANVIACDISSDSLKELEDSAGTNVPLETVAFDLTDADATLSAISASSQSHNGVDILVNITGGPPPGMAVETDPSNFSEYFDRMVAPVIRITSAVLPHMQRAGWGRIITSTSSGVVAPIPSLALSNSLRMSLVGWSKTLANEVAHQGITANIVVPGRIYTKRVESLDRAKAKRDGKTIDEVREQSFSQIPARRYGTAEEYSNVVTFLTSQKSSYVTGSVIRIDGGLIASV